MASTKGIEYDERMQWCETNSPLRVAWGNHFEGRQDYEWTVPPGFKWAGDPGVLEATIKAADAAQRTDDDTMRHSIYMKMNWQDTSVIVYHAKNWNIPCFMDREGQWYISGYQLHAAGIFDDGGGVAVSLSPRQRRELFGTAAVTELDHICGTFGGYSIFLSTMLQRNLRSGISDDPAENAILLSRLARWRRQVVDELATFGIESPSPVCHLVAPDLESIPEEHRKFALLQIKQNSEILMEAGAIVEWLNLKDAPAEVQLYAAELAESIKGGRTEP
jgi:hypothetical protein